MSARITIEYAGGRAVDAVLSETDAPDPSVVELRAGSVSVRIAIGAANSRAVAAFFSGHAERVQAAAKPGRPKGATCGPAAVLAARKKRGRK